MLLVVAVPAVARAQAQVIDGHTARARGLEPVDLTVRVGRVSVDQGVEHFLAVATQRGARHAGGLHWVWARRDEGMTLECTALVVFYYDAGRRLVADTGPSHCLPVEPDRAAWIDEIRGEMYVPRERLGADDVRALRLERRSRRLSRSEMRSLSRLLEPEAETRPAYRMRRHRAPARVHRLSRRELDRLVRELE